MHKPKTPGKSPLPQALVDNLWKPGQSGNPKGRGRIPEALRGVQQLGLDEVRAACGKYTRMTVEALEYAIDNPETPAMELVIAKSLMTAISKGDMTQLNFILDRAIGKPKELPDKQDVSQMSLPEILQLARVAMRYLEEHHAIPVEALSHAAITDID